ncbi:MAG: GHKL domain-containing protein [Lactobacillus sp.]|jgi:two-component system sensor histidine kinase AgrC|nr:GHKL domain-containing protein [Lactobacillus sp.]MCI2033275.1 GHKL domain-containing protein [Lactobacillus sp.]
MIQSIPLRSLLYLKWTEANEHQINLTINTNGDIALPPTIDMMGLIRCLGILLDNALFATQEIHYQKFDLLVMQDRGTIQFTVSNAVGNEFNLRDLIQDGFSTKGSGHGNGLMNLRQIIAHNPQFSFTQLVEDHQLSMSIIIQGE